jgi:hypothetical protein
MFREIKNKVWQILNFTPIGPLLQLYMVGEIKENGWMRSFIAKKAIDKNGNPIPWYTYPAVDFLNEVLNKKISVFEYGCGGSTKWLADRVGSITAVEDNQTWKEFAEKSMPENAKIILQPIDNEYSYSKSIKTSHTKYDLIIIDGKERNEAVANCLDNLSAAGILVLDDSFREAYKVSFDLLEKKGFKKLNFWGMTPIIATKSCTTFFYREGNIFNI